MNDVSWIKITTDIFDNEKIKLLETMPDGDTLIVVWFKLITLAGKKNAGGMVFITNDIPFTPESLSVVFSRPLNTIKLALKCFIDFKMIEVVNDFYQLVNWDKYQNEDGLMKIREQGRLRAEKHREKMKLLINNNAGNNAGDNVIVTLRNATEKEEELDIDKELDKELDKDIKEESHDKPALPSKPKRIKKEFVIPTIEEVTEYVLEKQLVINPYKFIDWYTKSNWKDTEGNQVKNWKNKANNWDSRELEKNKNAKPYSIPYSSSKNEKTGIVVKTCPKCGESLDSFLTCQKCHIEYDVTGRAI